MNVTKNLGGSANVNWGESSQSALDLACCWHSGSFCRDTRGSQWNGAQENGII